jgi:DNA-binding GntR family transcriptional regulator
MQIRQFDLPVKTNQTKEGEVDRVYRLLKHWLIECKLMPGESLSEARLAEGCETSRTPIREACSRLAQEGWVKNVRHKGYIVTPVSIRDVLQTYEYRKLLESFTAEKAASTATADQIEVLASVVEVERRPGVAVEEVVAANDRFHLEIAGIAGNQRVLDQLKLTLEYVHRLDVLSAQRNKTWIPHGEIVSAIQARRPTEARQAMMVHVDCSRDRMLQMFAG